MTRRPPCLTRNAKRLPDTSRYRAQRHEGVILPVIGKLAAFGEDQADRRRVRFEQHVGNDGLLDQVGAPLRESGLRVRPYIGIGPAVEAALAHRRQIIWHQFVAESVALVHHRVEFAGIRMEGDADRVAQAAGVNLAAAAVGRESLDRGARFLLDGEVAAAADRDEEMAAFGAESDITRPVPTGIAERAVRRYRLRFPGRTPLARLPAIAPRSEEH